MTILPRAIASLFIITLIVPYAVNADVFYEITPYVLSDGYSVDGGFITVLDGSEANGTLEIGEITGFTIETTTPVGPLNFTPSNTTIGLTGSVLIDGFGITIDIDPTSTELLFDMDTVGGTGAGGTLNAELSYLNLPPFGGRIRLFRPLAIPISGHLNFRKGSTITIATAIPEPSSFMLMCLGSAGLLASGSRRKRKLPSVAS
jgi:hypothetical protein